MIKTSARGRARTHDEVRGITMHNVTSEQRRGMSLFFDHRDPTRWADSAPPGSTSERANEKEDADVWLDS